MSDRLSVLVFDEQPMVRWGLQNFLDNQSGIKVVGAVSSLEDAVELVKLKEPDVLILDPASLSESDIRALGSLPTNKPLGLLAFAAHEDLTSVKRFLEIGGMGYVSKHSPLDELLSAVQAVAQGRRWTSPSLCGELRSSNMKAAQILSPRECEIAALIAGGLTSKQIADRLGISPKTVEAHRYRIFKKLGISRSAQLVEYTLKNNTEDA